MKDLQKYFQQGLIFVNGYGIKAGDIRKVETNSTSKRWGQATQKYDVFGKKYYTIQIAEKLLSDEVEDKHLMSTIVHEILHTVDGCMTHKGKWKVLADEITRTSDLVIKRVTSAEEKNINVQEAYKYVCRCDKCGYEIGKERMSQFIKYPNLYTHRNCGGHFTRIK